MAALEGLIVTSVALSPEAASRIFETAIDAGHTYGFGYWAKLLEVEQSDDHRIVRIQLKEHNDGHDNRGKKAWLSIADLRRGVLAFLNTLATTYPKMPSTGRRLN